MPVRVFLILLAFFLAAALPAPNTANAQDLERYSYHSRHMGTQFSIILYAKNETVAREAADAAFERIEELNQMMSDYVEDSEVNRLSRRSGSGEWMELSSELVYILEESVCISEMSGGVFDVTVGPMTRAWRMTRMMPEPRLPDEQEREDLLNRVGYQHIEFDEAKQAVRLTRPDMQLDLGGIAKGYAAEEAVRVLQSYGISSTLVDAGGDITLGDPPPGRSSWDVAIPKILHDSKTTTITLQLHSKTVTTSGDMFQFIEIDGQRYSHILHPETGLGSTSQQQATVVSDKGIWADAYASVLTLMPPEEGVKLIHRLENTEGVIFEHTPDGIKEWKSDGFDAFLRP